MFQRSSETDNSMGKQNAIEKTITILLSFMPANDPISTAELSRNLGFHKATTSRILNILADHGFVKQHEDSRMYSLGPSIVRLAEAVKLSLDAGIISIARPYLTDLRKKTGHTVTLEILSGHQAVMGCIVDGDMAIRVAGQVGDIVQWNTTAGMRAILAFSDETLVGEVMKQPMLAVTHQSITNPKAYKLTLAEVRRDGYAFESGEVAIGVDALAAPIIDHSGKPISSVSIVGLSYDIQRNRGFFIEAIKDTALSISRAFMYGDSLPNGHGIR